VFTNSPFFPERASTFAPMVDDLYFFLVALTAFFSLLIAGLLAVFALKYRRRSHQDMPARIAEPKVLEIAWIAVPLAIVVGIFFWSAYVYVAMNRPPRDAVEVYVVGKRWMWKVQHLTGQREINELHVPLGVPIKLNLTSEDVIHSFFVPAFRVKKDAVPGRYSVAWFEATRPGRYHLFCAEYCGTKHSGMTGWVEVMEPARFQAWLAGGAAGTSLAAAGEKLFADLACVTCHKAEGGGRGPVLDGVFGRQVRLQNGETVAADEAYIRESIVTPSAKLVAGFQPVMPTYQGLVSEEGLMQLIAYIRGLKAPAASDAGGAPAEPKGPPARTQPGKDR
jgi:cytochrome c oxidase subunit 2